MRITIILAAAIIGIGLMKWLRRAAAYHTPAAAIEEVARHQMQLLYGQYTNIKR